MEHINMIVFVVRTVEQYCDAVRKGKIELECSETIISPIIASQLNATIFLYHTREVEPQVVEVFQPQQPEDVAVELVTIL
jgi:hypothetical protein